MIGQVYSNFSLDTIVVYRFVCRLWVRGIFDLILIAFIDYD